MSNWTELMGIVATLFILFAFTSSNKTVIRIVNSIGSVLFVIYGLTIGAFSVWFLNGTCIVVNMYKLYKENKETKCKGDK